MLNLKMVLLLMLIGVLNLSVWGLETMWGAGGYHIKPIDDTIFKFQSKNQNMINFEGSEGVHKLMITPPTSPDRVRMTKHYKTWVYAKG